MAAWLLFIVAPLAFSNCRGTQFPSSEFYALKDLFIATNGAEWHWRDETYGAIWNFTTGANPCVEYWQGVTCVPPPQDSFYYVSKLNLSQYNLVGQLPSSVEQLTQLTHLNLGGNGLVGTMPRSIGNLINLQHLNLSTNFLSERIPSEIGNLPNLATVLLNSNQFTGSLPTTFAQLNALRQLMLQFNDLSGPVQQAFDSSTQTALNYVSLNNNQFSGTLPESLLSNPNLQSIYLDNNCFEGNLTETVCGSTQLEVLSLGCLHSASECVLYPFQPISNTFMQSSTVHGTLPACVFEIPSLQLLNLGGNAFSGTLPAMVNISPNLTEIVLMYNDLTGTLPDAFQKHQLNQLYLSHNHLTGSLSSQVAPFPSNQFWNLADNRLSGSVPTAVRTADSVNVLTGNMMTCFLDKTDLPQNDHGRLNYQCGSNSFDEPSIIWTVLIGTSIAVFGGAYYFRHSSGHLDIEGSFAKAHIWILCARQVKAPSLTRVREVAQHLTIMACVCASALLILGIPTYVVLTGYYGTYNQQYAWTASFVLLSGVGPFVFGFLLFILAIVLFTAMYTYYNKHTRSAMREQFLACGEVPPFDVICLCAGYFLINLSVSVTVNMAYVYVMVREPATFDVLISLYKMFWNGVCAPHLSRYMLKRLHMTSADLFSLELYISLMNNVMVPIAAIVFIHPRCFYGVFAHNTRFSSSFNYVWTYYAFPFRYNYQCSFEYMKYYSAAFIYLAIFTTFGIPAYELSLLFLYKRATPGTYWFRVVNYMLPRILKPVPADSPRSSDVTNPVFDGKKFLIALLTCLALILSLGVVTPLLAGCLALCMVGACAYTVLKVGRYLHDVQDTPYAKHYLDAIEAESCGVVNNIMLRKSFWLLFFLSCWFMSPFLFDTLGASVGFESSYWVLIAIPMFPWVVFFIYRITRTHFVWNYFCTICYGKFVADEETPSKASERPASLRVSEANSLVGIELHGVVHNSLLSSGSDAEGCDVTV